MSVDGTLRIAESIRQQRLRFGWTQLRLARQSGLSVCSYARFERAGGITLKHLVAVANALGLDVSLAPTPGVIIEPDPLAVRIRKRGVRHRQPAPAPVPPPGPPPSPTPKPIPRPPVDPSDVERVARQYRDSIALLVGVIVLNRLTNYTAAPAVQNVMRAQHVPEPDEPAFVAAVEAVLSGLNAENCAAYSIDQQHLATWTETWQADLGIVGVLD